MTRDDDIEALLRLAGRRPAVPENRVERSRAAVEAAWRQMVRSRRRRRLKWLTAAAAVAALLVALVWIQPGRRGGHPLSDGNALEVASVRGSAWSEEPQGGRVGLAEGAKVKAGAAVITGDGRLELRYGSAASVRLDTATRVTLLDERTLRLDQGGLYIDSGRYGGIAAVDPLSVRTALGTIQAEGTQYEVRLGEGLLTVSVREGTVLLDHRGTVHRVARARRLRVNAGEAPALEEVATHGPSWEWTAEIATVPDFSGRSARAFLEWVARERGLELRFADEQLARSADSILLGGSVGRLRPDEALQAVLPTCGMRHQVDGASLVILAE